MVSNTVVVRTFILPLARAEHVLILIHFRLRE